MNISRITQATFGRMLENPGKHSLGGGLMLLVRSPGKASFSMRYQKAGVRRELGLGAHPVVTLGMARERVLANQRLIEKGQDPWDARAEAEAAERTATTFSEAVAAYLADHGAALGAKAKQAWRATLGTYANPVFGSKAVRDVDTDDVLAVLRPLWSSKTPTAVKLQRRMAKVMAYARARLARYHGEPRTLAGSPVVGTAEACGDPSREASGLGAVREAAYSDAPSRTRRRHSRAVLALCCAHCLSRHRGDACALGRVRPRCEDMDDPARTHKGSSSSACASLEAGAHRASHRCQETRVVGSGIRRSARRQAA